MPKRLHRAKIWAFATALVGLALLPAPAPTSAAPHWIDSFPSGTDLMIGTAVLNIDLGLDGTVDVTAHLAGPLEIFRGTGTTVPDHHMDTELVAIQLTGNTPFGPMTFKAGDGNGNLSSDGPLYSAGRYTEQSGNPSLADSFFDVFFELDAPGLSSVPLRNLSPLHLVEVISGLPPSFPDGLVGHSSPPCPLSPGCVLWGRDALGRLVKVAQLIDPSPRVPEPSGLGLLAAGAMGLALLRRRRRG